MNEAEAAALLEVTRQRAEALSVVDAQVKRTVDALHTAGQLENTLLVFTSDNEDSWERLQQRATSCAAEVCREPRVTLRVRTVTNCGNICKPLDGSPADVSPSARSRGDVGQ